MQWSDEAIVLGARRHGESAVILEVMTPAHGRHLGLVHGGRSRAMQPVLQPGNTVQAVWRARLDEHLGIFTIEAGPCARLASEPRRSRSRPRGPRPRSCASFPSATRIRGSTNRCGARRSSRRRGIAPALFVRFELALLAELGFGLDLSRCAATGSREDLVYVSPRSGRAVSAAAGAAYRDRLLALPGS